MSRPFADDALHRHLRHDTTLGEAVRAFVPRPLPPAIVAELTGQKKNRSFSDAAYVDLLAR